MPCSGSIRMLPIFIICKLTYSLNSFLFPETRLDVMRMQTRILEKLSVSLKKRLNMNWFSLFFSDDAPSWLISSLLSLLSRIHTHTYTLTHTHTHCWVKRREKRERERERERLLMGEYINSDDSLPSLYGKLNVCAEDIGWDCSIN